MIEQALLLDNPFPGLRPFDTDESDRFFGRDGQSDEVLAKLRRSRFVAVVGTSGSGKSSLVRAGVLPALYSGHLTSAGSHWRVAIFRPGDDPIGNLAESLGKSGVLGGRFAAEGEARREIEATLRSSSLGLVQAIADARLKAHENLLLVADQFEELFRFRQKIKAERPEDEAAAFVKLLLEARLAGRASELQVYLVLTMRSDYLGEAAQFRGLPEAINEGQYLIPRMTDDEWREAITGPVWMHGAEITPQLVNRLLNDAGDRTLLKSAGEHADRLPILQHALMRTWEYWRNHRRGNEPIGIPHYLRVGGMAGALSQHADEAFFELPQRQQVVAEQLFRRLTEKGSDGREGRRPATVQEICDASEASPEDVRAVIESFRRQGRSFLMPPLPAPLAPDTLIDISHESLIWGWERLRNWVNQEASCARIVERLSETAALHAEGKEGFLRNPALQTALDWRASVQPNAVWAARYCPNYDQAIAFLEASHADFEREETQKEAQRQRELAQAQEIAEKARLLADERQRRVKLQRIGLMILSVLLIGLAMLTGYAFQQKGEAQRKNAEAQKQKGIALEKTRDALLERDRADAERRKTEAALKRVEVANKATEAALKSAEVAEKKAVKERNSAQLAQADAVSQRNKAQQALAEADTQRKIAEVQRAEAQTERAEAEKQKDEATKALALVKEIDSSAPFYKTIMRGDTAPITSLALNPRGDIVLTGNAAGEFRARYAESDGYAYMGAANGLISTAVFSHDNFRTLIASRNEASIDALTRKPGLSWHVSLSGHTDTIKYAAFSPDDKLAVTASADRTARVWDVGTGTQKLAIEHKGAVNYAAFSPDGKLLVTASDDSTAQVWDLEKRQQLAVLYGHLARINRAYFSHDGRNVATASADNTAMVWDARTGQKWVELTGHTAEVNNAVFSPDDRFIVTVSKDKTARLWETVSAAWRRQFGGTTLAADRASEHTGEVNDAIFANEGKWIVTISQDKTARVWNLGAKESSATAVPLIAVLSGHIRPVTSVAFDERQKYLVTGSEDHTVRVWNLSELGGGLNVKADLKADPPNFSGACPVTVRFTGLLTATGGGGKVKYQFVRSDGAPALPEEVTFDGPGEKQVSTTWQLDRSLTSAWVELRILEPAVMDVSRAGFNVRCRNYEQAVTVSTPTSPSTKQVSDEQLRQIMPTLSADKRESYLPHLRRAMDEFGINNPARQAAFLAQVAYETSELRVFEEKVSRFNTTLPGPPFFDKYDSRADLGNQGPPDGERFKGRGIIQLTGRANYQRYAKLVGVDLVSNPERAADPDVVFRIAGLLWQQYGLNELADQQSFHDLSRRFVGGSAVTESKLRYYNIAKQVLGVPAPPPPSPKQ